MAIIPHPPCSPDLAPCDFALFPKLKIKLKGRFETVASKGNRKRYFTASREITYMVLF
jgi:hypothetical protein